MAATRLNLRIEEGATWDPVFALWTTRTLVDGLAVYSDPVDLTAYGVRLQWRKSLDATSPIVSLDSASAPGVSGGIIIDAAPGSGVPNRIRPIVPATVLAALNAADWTNDGGLLGGVWDMERYEKIGSGPGGTVVVRRMFRGSLTFDREVTQ